MIPAKVQDIYANEQKTLYYNKYIAVAKAADVPIMQGGRNHPVPVLNNAPKANKKAIVGRQFYSGNVELDEVYGDGQ